MSARTTAVTRRVARRVRDAIADQGYSVARVAGAIEMPASTLRGRLRDGRCLTIGDTCAIGEAIGVDFLSFYEDV